MIIFGEVTLYGGRGMRQVGLVLLIQTHGGIDGAYQDRVREDRALRYGGQLRRQVRRRGGEGEAGNLERYQQPQEDHPPQGVPHPGGQRSEQGPPQKQKDRQQNGRGDAPGDEQLHHVPSASFKMAYSSSISSLVRAFSRAMEDTIRPTLPWYTRSRKERVSWRAAFSRSTAGK